ncbi:unnamed protein product, partial [Clonostachys byssicola]
FPRRRRSSQKPGDDLLANFRQQFPEIASTSTTAPAPPIAQTSIPDSTLNIGIAPQESQPQALETAEPFQDHDPTPRATNEPWRFTPSLMDPNSYNFNSFANAPAGYYTPTPGGTNTLFHPQAGDLHTPMGLTAGHGLGTPLSMPTSANAIQSGVASAAGPVEMAGFQPLPTHQLHHFNPFVQAPPPPPQPTFAPSTFVHQDTGYETMEQDGSPLTSNPPEDRMPSIGSNFQPGTTLINFQSPQLPGVTMSHTLPSFAEKFRFHSTLNAPTAMIKHADEIPVTYLNKGQAYSLSIIDTQAAMPLNPGTRFRTFVRVSFEDEEQRQKPSVCWGLWKEGRGQNEAHQRGGKLQAVEYVEAGQPVEGDEKKTRVELDTSSFDGFSVIWTPGSQGVPEVNIAVRFNFLSTDFSHSKGVKGIPVRLCAKTRLLSGDGSPNSPEDSTAEICFCKVKLFRDHGAERKLSNDVAHVKKSIDKVKHQINQVESGLKDVGKRKRSGAKVKMTDNTRVGKATKHKRTWSMSSASSVDGGSGAGGSRTTLEDDLHYKLQTLSDMFTSTRPVSVLYLRGEDLDDPDAHPVSLPGNQSPQSKPDGSTWPVKSAQSSIADSMVSPSPSSLSLASQQSTAAQGGQWQNFDVIQGGDAPPKAANDKPVQINKTDDGGKTSGYIEAVGVDPTYCPPPDRTPKPVACFYILRPDNNNGLQKQYYRAVYLMQRNLQEFNRCVAEKWNLEPTKIRRTIHTIRDGLDIEMDDDVIRALREGQDMTLEVDPISDSIKSEWEMAVDSIDETPTETTFEEASGYILRLYF